MNNISKVLRKLPKESAEQKAKRIQEDNEKNLFDRVQSLEEFTGINKGGEFEEWDGKFRIGETYIHKSTVVLCIRSSLVFEKTGFSGIVIKTGMNSDTKVGEFSDAWNKKNFTPYTLPNKGEIV